MAVSGTKKPNGHLFQNKNSKSLSPSPKDNHIKPLSVPFLQPRFCFLSQETQERGIFLKPQEKWQTTNRKKPGEEEERKIPFLTVPRNGAILKNIFSPLKKLHQHLRSRPLRKKRTFKKLKKSWVLVDTQIAILY